MREDVGLLAYSPLGQGFLTGKYLDGARPAGARTTLFDRGQRYQTPGAEAGDRELCRARRRTAASTRRRWRSPSAFAPLRDLHDHRRDHDGAAQDGHRLDRRDDDARARSKDRRDPPAPHQSLSLRRAGSSGEAAPLRGGHLALDSGSGSVRLGSLHPSGKGTKHLHHPFPDGRSEAKADPGSRVQRDAPKCRPGMTVWMADAKSASWERPDGGI